MRIPGLFLLAATVACGANDETPSDTASSDIYGGSTSSFQASVLLTQAGAPQCSGTLIAPRVVLAAASCDKFFTGVVAGWSEKLGPNYDSKVHAPDRNTYFPRRTAVHPSFRGIFNGTAGCPARRFDVMLIELDRPVTGIEPARIPAGPPEVGARCRLVGFGTHATNGATERAPNDEATVGERREVPMRIASLDREQARAEFIGGSTGAGDLGATLLCAGDAVVGVSGSCGDVSKGDIVTRTDAVRGFIDDTMKSWGMTIPE